MVVLCDRRATAPAPASGGAGRHESVGQTPRLPANVRWLWLLSALLLLFPTLEAGSSEAFACVAGMGACVADPAPDSTESASGFPVEPWVGPTPPESGRPASAAPEPALTSAPSEAIEAASVFPGLWACVDSHPGCKGWAQRGECQANAAYMTANCCASCNLVAGATCTDRNPSCQAWARRGECQANPRYMLFNCCASCRPAQQPPPPPPPPPLPSTVVTLTVQVPAVDPRSGTAWDTGLSPLPDLALCLYESSGAMRCLPWGGSVESVGQPACDNAESCVFRGVEVSGDPVRLIIVDVDLVDSNDIVGEGSCAIGQTCQLGGAQLTVAKSP